MTVFDICADESGKLGKNTDYTSFCGYIAHVSEWQRFDQEWKNCRLRFQAPPIHMSRIMNPDQKNDDWKRLKDEKGKNWDAWRDLLLQDLAKTILSAQIVCVGAAVDSAHFRDLCDADSKFKERFKDPIYLALHTLVMRGIEKTEIVDSCSPIGVFVDDDPQFAKGVYDYVVELKQHFTKVKSRVHSVSFVNDASYSGIQAADVIAYETRKLMVEVKNDPATPMSDRYRDLTLFGSHQPKRYDAKTLDELRATMP